MAQSENLDSEQSEDTPAERCSAVNKSTTTMDQQRHRVGKSSI